MSGRTYVALDHPAYSHQPKRRLSLILLVIGACLLLMAIGLASWQLAHGGQTPWASARAANHESGNQPSSQKPATQAVASYQVAPAMPRYLDIPSLGVHGRIFPLGVTSDGSLAAPSNIYDTGWYNKSALPGQPGAMLIDGHVSSWTAKGVFYNLKNLKPGDTLQVERGDGKTFTYRVVKSQNYPSNNVDMQSAMKPVTLGKPGLNLITCTGNVIHGTSDFNARLIVYTEQVS